MRNNDIGEVERIARQIAQEEIAKALERHFAPPAAIEAPPVAPPAENLFKKNAKTKTF